MSVLNQKLFSVVDNLRGKMDASEYKNYLLGLIFYKYLSDNLLEKVVIIAGQSLADYETQNEKTILYTKLLSQEDTKENLLKKIVDILGYHIEPKYLFNFLCNQAQKNSFQLTDLSKAFINLVAQYDQFNGLFDDIDLKSRKIGLNDEQRNFTITEILKKLNYIELLSYEGDVIGDAYEFLISQFASEAGKKAGEFYTPYEVSDMVARIASIGQENKKSFSVFDPTMGSGSLMLNIRNYLLSPSCVKYYGQELNTQTFNLARMNLILHGIDNEDINVQNTDTLSKDWLNYENKTFDAVLMNPPYSAEWSADDIFLNDPRFNKYGRLAPKTKADFAFLLHGFYHLKKSGTMAIVLPHGILFRDAAEGVIRRKLLEDGNIDAVIGLPRNLFYGTSIPTTVIILKKNRETRDVLFIDASNEFIKGRNQNKLSFENINKVVEIYKLRKTIEKYSYVARFDEIEENNFNLNIPRYIEKHDEEETINIVELSVSLKKNREEKIEIMSSLYTLIKSLDYKKEDGEWIKEILEVFDNEKK